MQQYQAQLPRQPDQPPPLPDAGHIVEQLRSIGGALAVIAGLIGALAVHVIFVGTFLPQIVAQSSLDTTTATAISDILGFALFYGLAGLAGRSVVARGRRWR
jgi:hypothetical protein